LSASSDHVIVLPGGGYAEHAANEGEPIAQWLQGFGVAASVFHYPLMARHQEAKPRPPSLRFDHRDARCARRFGDRFRAALGWHVSRLLCAASGGG
jgi:predicted alpha/beta-hydrolase family hydrolase